MNFTALKILNKKITKRNENRLVFNRIADFERFVEELSENSYR